MPLASTSASQTATPLRSLLAVGSLFGALTVEEVYHIHVAFLLMEDLQSDPVCHIDTSCDMKLLSSTIVSLNLHLYTISCDRSVRPAAPCAARPHGSPPGAAN